MQAYRRRLRAAGLRPVQIWVPDVNSRGFAARLRKQVAKLDRRNERDALAFIAAIADEI